MTSILMLAAEHGGLVGGKVGGIGDVIQQLPPALVAAGATVDVLLPSYGVYHLNAGAKRVVSTRVAFAGSIQLVTLYQLPAQDGAGCWVVHHPVFSAPAGQIYHHDAADQPFATDANIYALFCAAAAQLLADGKWLTPEVVHMHDWHAGTFAVLARSHKKLSELKLVYTIHNLALQGTRPLKGHPSSLASWFPDLELKQEYLQDPTYADCYNPTRAALSLVDKIHVVSPSYAREVLESNDLELGLHGGEGLEFVLQPRAEEGDLVGLLNGCAYPDEMMLSEPAFADAESFAQERTVLTQIMQRTLAGWMGQYDALRSSDFLARETLASLSQSFASRFLLTSVGRITDQKVGLLLHTSEGSNDTLLDKLLAAISDQGCFVMLGAGDESLERQLVEHAARHQNFVFLRGYSDALADALYRAGDLFVMPSLFEPCGISQLLAMRCGQPCLVHATGGLKDTVDDDVDGFCFEGADLDEKAANCEQALSRALALYANPRSYREMRTQARAKRLSWLKTAKEYIQRLYRVEPSRRSATWRLASRASR